jgi:hypothetical protein
MHIIPHTCWVMNICELTLAINPPQVKSRCHPRRSITTSSTESRCRLPVNLMAQGIITLLVHSIFYHLFCKTFCFVTKIVIFVSIHWVIICVEFIWWTYETHPGLCHTRFWKVNRIRTMYVPVSEIHVHSDYIIGHHHTLLKIIAEISTLLHHDV